MEHFLADLVLVVHFIFIAFVVLGLMFVWSMGRRLGRSAGDRILEVGGNATRSFFADDPLRAQVAHCVAG